MIAPALALALALGAVVGFAVGSKREEAFYRKLWHEEIKARTFWFEEAMRRGDELLAVTRAKRKTQHR